MTKSWELLKKKLQDLGAQRGFKAELARRIGVSPNAIQRYFSEADTTIPGLDLVERIAEALGVQPWELIKPDSALPTPVPEQPGVAQLLEAIEKLNIALKEAQKNAVPDEMRDIAEALKAGPPVNYDTVRSVLGLRKHVRKAERKSG